VVADVMDRESLLTAVRDVRADAVMHQLTARWAPGGWGRRYRARTPCAPPGPPTSSRPPGRSAPTASSPSRSCSGTAPGTMGRT
jgi:hypothetical protein